MADLTAYEKEILENLLGLKNNSVLDMDKDEFLYFINKYIDIDLDNFEEYQDLNSANLFRKMLEIESDYTVSVMLKHLLEWYLKHKYYEVEEDSSIEFDDTYFANKIQHYSECKRIENSLMFKDYYRIPKQKNKELDILIDDIRESLGRDIPQLIIDRLHTFTMSFLRNICIEHNIEIIDDNENKYSMTNLMGKIARYYEGNNVFESEFSIIAIKSSISIFEKFNQLRNGKSYAHANQTLNTLETNFAVKSIINVISFMDSMERMLKYLARIEDKKNRNILEIDLPF